jgi:ATP-dependent DNA ligase
LIAAYRYQDKPWIFSDIDAFLRGIKSPSNNRHIVGDGDIVYRQACQLGCEGIVSKRLGSPYRSGRSKHWVKVKNPAAPAVRREAEEDWRH